MRPPGPRPGPGTASSWATVQEGAPTASAPTARWSSDFVNFALFSNLRSYDCHKDHNQSNHNAVKTKGGQSISEVSPIRKDFSNVPKFGTFGTFGMFEMSFQSV